MSTQIEERYRPKPQKALRTRTAPLHFLRELDATLRAAGISRHAPSRLLRARCAADEGDAFRPGTHDDVPARMGRVMVFIEEHLDEPLSVNRLADEADLSKYYFSRRFHEEVGHTPWAYVREMRLQKAKALLEQGASPATAALEAGFFDQSHLTNVMKDVEGKTPKQYQQEQERHEPNRKDLQE